MAPRRPLVHLLGPPNYFDELECAVNLRITPVEFLQFVTITLHAHEAREILCMMGFTRLPFLINDNETLDDALEDTKASGERLNAEQIREFDRLAYEVVS